MDGSGRDVLACRFVHALGCGSKMRRMDAYICFNALGVRSFWERERSWMIAP